MDAIFGLWNLDGATVESSVLEDMATSLESTPDKQRAFSLHCSGPVGLGRVTIGRSVEDLPVTREGSLTCVADARLYRAPATAAPLDLSTTDRERLFCRLHAELGDDAPNHLEGDFAYAIWDEEKQRLSLIRDQFGVRPLFFYHVPGKLFAWASHSEMLSRSGITPNDFDLETALNSFVLGDPDPESTLVPGLSRLPAAHVLHLTSSGLAKRRYWTLEPGEPVTDDAKFEECAATLRRLLDNAVRRRLPKDGTIGAHMSGGLDSTAISVLAARALAPQNRPLHTYSFVAEYHPGVQFVDERPYVDATVQGEPNIYNSKITLSERDGKIIDAWVDRVGGYTGTEEKVLEAAERDGADVILSGWGGDEVVTFNGRGAYAEHFVRGRWKMLWNELKARSELYRISRKRVFAGEVLSYILPDRLYDLLRRAAGKETAIMANQKLARFLNPSFRKRLRPSLALGTNTRRNRLTLLNSDHIADALEVHAMQGAHHGIQYTFPLLDRELLEYAVRLPASFFLRNGVRRAVFREAMQDVLPESVRTRRPKFAPFPCALLRASERKAEYLKELDLLRQDPQLAKLFDFNAIEAALQEIPNPSEVKEAFNAEAAGGPSVSLGPLLATDPINFAHFLKARLESQSTFGQPK
ncbi:asparagine synthase-related protein [Aliiruegeria sabulilitoris]|uniref:asparagine synthase-related protein n=1 Tax=Aliiruegeria sabulilitoris TaxID=1510458 RepID=UPI0009E79C8F|nr:asparagine synthase-related protein [Aliiruegeria sabulilitoris]NDR55716.1 hypothetical protein [Pseudoruegeria sp. M32A2M]